MRLIKTLGLAAVAAMAAMAFVGVSSTSAANTQLCNSHVALTCSSAATSVGMADTNYGVLLGNIADIECDTVTGTGAPLALANPQQVHVTSLTFESCETHAGHPCAVTVNELPLANLNKTGLDAGTLTGTNGKVFVECIDPVFWTIDVECEYDLTGVQATVGAQHLTVNETPIDVIGSTAFCLGNETLDGLLTTTANRYVLA
jgi:hypothetical protein